MIKYLKNNRLLLIICVIPSLVSMVYFTFIASDVYISESSFVIKSVKSDSNISGTLNSILNVTGISRAQDDTYAVDKFIHSREALHGLEKNIDIRNFYSNNGDWFSRFNFLGINGENEAFYNYFNKKITTYLDPVSGIETLLVRSFDSKHAQEINSDILKLSEDFINQINNRAQKDLIEFALKNKNQAEIKLKEAATKLSRYRTEHGIFDVKSQGDLHFAIISKIQDELINVRAQQEQLRVLSPQNPQLITLKAREKILKEEYDNQVQSIFGVTTDSISNQVYEYQNLVLENEIAQKQLTSEIISLENAKTQSQKQQLYLDVITKPSTPDLADEPKRWYNIISTIIISLILYGIINLLLASIREHRN